MRFESTVAVSGGFLLARFIAACGFVLLRFLGFGRRTKMRTAAFAVLTDAQKAKLTDKQKRIFGAAAKAKKPKKN
ncbi:MAG: hypothetical protein AAFP69_07355, partial [Planctomycetota bacterium]